MNRFHEGARRAMNARQLLNKKHLCPAQQISSIHNDMELVFSSGHSVASEPNCCVRGASLARLEGERRSGRGFDFPHFHHLPMEFEAVGR